MESKIHIPELVRVNGMEYVLLKKLGFGSVGEVYLARDEKTTEVAMKIQTNNSRNDRPLLNENTVYQMMNEDQGLGIPRFISYGVDRDRDVLVMEPLGDNLQTLLESCEGKFSLKTVLMLADQMIRRVAYVHQKGLVHHDIKPEHFAVGVGEKSNTVYLMDFGISKRYMDEETKAHVYSVANTTTPFGTLRYASRHNDGDTNLSRCDDMESLGYVFIYLLKGKLPWDKETCGHRVRELKRRITVEKLCEDLPQEFAQYMWYFRQLGYSKEPDYANLRTSFSLLMSRHGMQMDNNFDWEVPVRQQSIQKARASSAPSETQAEAKAQDPDMKLSED